MHAQKIGRLAQAPVGFGQHVRDVPFLELALGIVIADPPRDHVIDEPFELLAQEYQSSALPTSRR